MNSITDQPIGELLAGLQKRRRVLAEEMDDIDEKIRQVQGVLSMMRGEPAATTSRFPCGQCDGEFKTSGGLKHHVTVAHKTEQHIFTLEEFTGMKLSEALLHYAKLRGGQIFVPKAVELLHQVGFASATDDLAIALLLDLPQFDRKDTTFFVLRQPA